MDKRLNKHVERYHKSCVDDKNAPAQCPLVSLSSVSAHCFCQLLLANQTLVNHCADYSGFTLLVYCGPNQRKVVCIVPKYVGWKRFFPFLVLNSLSMLTFLSQWQKRLQMVKKAHIHLCAPSTWHSYRTPCFPNVSNYDCIQAFTAVSDIYLLMEIASVTLKKN